jgi:uncharacterized protein YqjF (DUF2071 family)
MRQSWRDLLFAHWPVPASRLRGFVPPSVEIQELDGTSWVGVVPFRMEGVTARPLPAFPGISAFAELNLRLYVTVDGKPGVWFVSLDAANRLAVWAARRFFQLPYYHAEMEVREEAGRFQYRSVRRGAGPRVAFRAAYGPVAEVSEARPGTLEHFLAERYCLYTRDRAGALWRADIHHAPWPLQLASAELAENTIGDAQGLALPGPPALLHFARRLDVVVWPLARVGR